MNNNNKIIFIAIIAVLTLVAAIAGVTYAFFSVAISSGQYITGTTGLDNDSLKLEVRQLSAGTGKLIPLVDDNVQNIASGNGGNDTCIDSNNNTRCKVYSITISNESEVKMNVTGTLTLTAPDMPNLKWAKGTSATTGFPTPTGEYYTKSEVNLADDTLEAKNKNGDSKTYYIVVWISDQNSVQNDSGKFKGTVNFQAYVTDGNGNNYQGITSTFGG